MVAISGMSR